MTAARLKAAQPADLGAVIAAAEQAVTIMADPNGWNWLLRSDSEGGGYFANLSNVEPDAFTSFPTFADSPEAALAHALLRFRQWLEDGGGDQRRKVDLRGVRQAEEGEP